MGQLITHTAGLGNALPIRWAHSAVAERPESEALLRRVMGRGRAYRYPVGGSARYSNLGYLALGQAGHGIDRDGLFELEPASQQSTEPDALPWPVSSSTVS